MSSVFLFVHSNSVYSLFSFDFQMDILEMLAMSGADLNAKNKNDETPSGEIFCKAF